MPYSTSPTLFLFGLCATAARNGQRRCGGREPPPARRPPPWRVRSGCCCAHGGRPPLLDLFQPFPAAAPPHAGEERGTTALLLRAAVRPAGALPPCARPWPPCSRCSSAGSPGPRLGQAAPPAGRPMAAALARARRRAWPEQSRGALSPSLSLYFADGWGPWL